MKRPFEKSLKRGIELFNAGRYPEALIVFRRCVKLGAAPAVSLYLDHIRHFLARGPRVFAEDYAALIARGKYREAEVAAVRAFRDDPSAAFRRFRDLWLNSSFRNLDGAPKSPWTTFFRASQAWSGLDDAKALVLLDKAGAGSKERAWMRYFSAEILLRRVQKLERADAVITRVVAECPWLWEARCLGAEIGFALGRTGRIAALEGLEPPGDGQAPFLAWRGVLKLWSGSYEPALSDLTRAEKLGNHDSRCWGGGAAALLGRLDEALAKLTALLTKDPADQEGLVFRAEVLRIMGRPREALRDLDGLLARSPDHPWALVNRALCSLALDDEASARRDYLRLAHGPKAARPAVKRETMERLLRGALREARGCRRSDPHVNFGWMRSAGVEPPRRRTNGAALSPWFKARGA